MGNVVDIIINLKSRDKMEKDLWFVCNEQNGMKIIKVLVKNGLNVVDDKLNIEGNK